MLSKANLEKNDFALANNIRTWKAVERVKKIDIAAQTLGLELPAQTKRQMWVSYSGASPHDQFFFDSNEKLRRCAVSEIYWAELVQRDSLAAEIEVVCRSTAQAVA